MAVEVAAAVAVAEGKTMMKCGACEAQQQQLLEDGDGSQVVCNCLEDDAMEQEEIPITTSTTTATSHDGSDSSSSSSSSDNDNNFPDDDDDANIEFPNDDDTGDVGDNIFTNAKPWREVPQKSWLRVTEIVDCTTKYRPANIVNLRARDGEAIKAWTTSIIGKALVNKNKNKGDKNLFIKSLGKTQSKNKKSWYYNFQLKLM